MAAMHQTRKPRIRNTSSALAASLLLAAVATASCAGPAIDPAGIRGATTAVTSDASASIARVDTMIGDAPCSNDAECRVVGVGAKACGGPESYRAWSTRTTDPKALMREAEIGAAARRAEIERLGMLSNCAITPVPPVRCAPPVSPGGAGRCVLDPVGSAGIR